MICWRALCRHDHLNPPGIPGGRVLLSGRWDLRHSACHGLHPSGQGACDVGRVEPSTGCGGFVTSLRDRRVEAVVSAHHDGGGETLAGHLGVNEGAVGSEDSSQGPPVLVGPLLVVLQCDRGADRNK